MKVLAVDLSLGSEDISVAPQKYGGIGRTLAYLRENVPNFYVAGMAKSFVNCGPNEKKEKNIILSEEDCSLLRSGNVPPNFDEGFDLIFHTNPGIYFPTRVPTLVWAVGFGEQFHPAHKFAVFHNYLGQKPIFRGGPVQTFEFVLGIDLPVFQEYNKEDFIFQCSCHYAYIQTHVVAYWAHRYNIPLVIAGPIAEDYHNDLSQFIDNKNVVYLGEVSEEIKINYLKRAKVVSALYAHEINETPLAIKQALAYGCQIFTTGLGHLQETVYDGVNGWYVLNEPGFSRAWNFRDRILQQKCYNSIQKYSLNNMVESIQLVFRKVLNV